MLMYGGIVTLSFPSGPSTSTVESLMILLPLTPFLWTGGGMKRNVTSGGKDSGTRPILDLQVCEVENEACFCLWVEKAGSKNEGSVISSARALVDVMAK